MPEQNPQFSTLDTLLLAARTELNIPDSVDIPEPTVLLAGTKPSELNAWIVRAQKVGEEAERNERHAQEDFDGKVGMLVYGDSLVFPGASSPTDVTSAYAQAIQRREAIQHET